MSLPTAMMGSDETDKEIEMPKQTKNTVATDVAATPAPGKPLFERVAGYLDANDWRYTADQEKGYFSMGCRIKETSVRVFIDVHESDAWNRVVAFSIYPVFVPENRRNTVVDALNRINYQLACGNFEMDPEDGELRFRTTVESGKGLDDEMFDRVLNGNLSAADRHFAPLMAIAFGGAGPEHVVEMADRPEKANLQ